MKSVPKHLLVTLANTAYLDKAKQLLSSAFFNANWHGETMLLAHEVKEADLKWFRDRNIFIKKCSNLISSSINNYNCAVTSKLHLFNVDMKKWKNIVFVDADVIIRKPFKQLFDVQAFSAKPEAQGGLLRQQFIHRKNPSDFIKWIFIKKNFDLSQPAFNSGVMAFPTNILSAEGFARARALLKSYATISAYGEQGILNLFFYKQWHPIDETFNTFPKYHEDFLATMPQDLDEAILHFADRGEENKPWNAENYFHQEWTKNLKKSSRIHFNQKL